MSDEIRLTLPRLRPFYRIAHLVLGGLAIRLDLTFEHLEDLQLALAGVLERHDGEGEITVSVRVDPERVHTSIGPFEGERLRSELDTRGEDLGLRRLLETVTDSVEVAERDGAHWIELTKSVATVRT